MLTFGRISGRLRLPPAGDSAMRRISGLPIPEGACAAAPFRVSRAAC